MAADLYDLTHAANAKRPPKPYPRPTDGAGRKKLGAKPTAGNGRAMLDRLAGGGYSEPKGPARDAAGRFIKQ